MVLTPGIRRLKNARVTYAAGIALFVAFTALAARITIPLPFTPVPVTVQVMAVLLAGLVLGSRAGALSQGLYLACIVAGLPLDAYGRGPAALAGPTAGYLIGFVGAAFVTGYLTEGKSAGRGRRFVAALAGLGAIYACGLAWLMPVAGGLWAAFQQGALPFLAVDVVKALIAAAVAEGGYHLLRP